MNSKLISVTQPQSRPEQSLFKKAEKHMNKNTISLLLNRNYIQHYTTSTSRWSRKIQNALNALNQSLNKRTVSKLKLDEIRGN